MPRGKLDSMMLFYKSVFGFDAKPTHELVDPYGLIQSRVLESRDRTIRLPLNTSASPRTATACCSRLTAAAAYITSQWRRTTFSDHGGFAARNVAAGRHPRHLLRRAFRQSARPAGERIDQMRDLGILYDRKAMRATFSTPTPTPLMAASSSRSSSAATMTGSAR